MTRYHDGYSAEDLDKPDINLKKLFYPAWWLEAVGFFNTQVNTAPGTIMFAPNPNTGLTQSGSSRGLSFGFWLSVLFTAVVSSLVTVYVSRFVANKSGRGGYSSISNDTVVVVGSSTAAFHHSTFPLIIARKTQSASSVTTTADALDTA
jgi:hypothetical protein